jgi:hypothetical protein
MTGVAPGLDDGWPGISPFVTASVLWSIYIHSYGVQMITWNLSAPRLERGCRYNRCDDGRREWGSGRIRSTPARLGTTSE